MVSLPVKLVLCYVSCAPDLAVSVRASVLLLEVFRLRDLREVVTVVPAVSTYYLRRSESAAAASALCAHRPAK